MFVGRDQKLVELDQKLQRSKRVAVVTGMGGVGKTELVLQYAHNQYDAGHYPAGVCWLSVRGMELGTRIVNFGRAELGLEPPDDFDLVQRVQWLWAHWRPQAGMALVVLDDVTEACNVHDYLPSDKRFRIVCTTRIQKVSGFEQLPLEVLKLEDALKLLRTLAGDRRLDDEPEAAVALCEWVGCLPLGLELVGQYLHQRPIDLSEMLEQLKKKRLEHKSMLKPTYGWTAQRGVREVFELTWQELTPEAQTVACVLSIFALAPIPWGAVEGSLGDWDEEDLEDVRDEELVRQSLVQDSGDGFYGLHQLVWEFLQEKLAVRKDGDGLKRGVGKVIVQTASQMPTTPTLEDISTFTPLLPHWKKAAYQLTNFLEDENLTWPFTALGEFYEGQGLYAIAEPWLEQGLNTTYQRLGKDHPSVAIMLNYCASSYAFQGKYEKAEPLFNQALDMVKKKFGEEHSEVSTTLNNLGELYRNQGQYEKAESYLLQAFDIQYKGFEEDPSRIVETLNNLALLYKEQKKYKQAEYLCINTLEMGRDVLGDKHFCIALILNTLALLYKLQDKYEQAESLYSDALVIEKNTFGEGHYKCVLTLNNIAELYRAQGKYKQAEPLYLEALPALFDYLGKEHPHSQGVFTNFYNFLIAVHQANLAHTLSNHPTTQNLLQKIRDDET